MSSGRGKSGVSQARSNKFFHINCPSSFHLIALKQRHAPANFTLTEQWFCHPLLTLLRKANSFGSWSATGRLFWWKVCPCGY